MISCSRSASTPSTYSTHPHRLPPLRSQSPIKLSTGSLNSSLEDSAFQIRKHARGPNGFRERLCLVMFETFERKMAPSTSNVNVANARETNLRFAKQHRTDSAASEPKPASHAHPMCRAALASCIQLVPTASTCMLYPLVGMYARCRSTIRIAIELVLTKRSICLRLV